MPSTTGDDMSRPSSTFVDETGPNNDSSGGSSSSNDNDNMSDNARAPNLPPEVHPLSAPSTEPLAQSIESILERDNNWTCKDLPKGSDNFGNSNNNNSLQMRKLPVDILLQPGDDEASLGASTLDSPSLQGDDPMTKRHSTSAASRLLLHQTCLNSKFTLRTQMMLSFGMVSSFTIVIVVLVSILASKLAGNQVIWITTQTFDQQAQEIAGTTAHYLADDLTVRIVPHDLVQILYEATRDRFAGYPVYQDDSRVPFLNSLDPARGTFYPLVGKPLPLDWQTSTSTANVNATNYHEHVQNRYSWFQHSPTLDTSNAAFYIQGMCDPAASPEDPKTRHAYLANCTDANNHIPTGGVIAPSPTTAQIHRKAADLVPLFKALHEYHQDIKQIGLYFSNSGAGATMLFPHYQLDSRAQYTSAGCNWLLDTHPLDPRRTVATLEEYERCHANGLHAAGNVFSSRLYNPMDRAWCANQALEPQKLHHVGPYQSAWTGQSLMMIGKAVYDRITNEFIACLAIDFTLDSMEDIMQAARVTPNSEVSIVRYNPQGSLLASTAWNKTRLANTFQQNGTTGTNTIEHVQVGLDAQGYQELFLLVDYKKPWDPHNVTQTYESFWLKGEKYLVSAYPIPTVPDTYQPNYRPEFLVVVSMDQEEWFRRSEELQKSVTAEVDDLEGIILIVGFMGLGMMILVILVVSNALTAPLTHINEVAGDIIDSFGETAIMGTGDNDGVTEVDRKILERKCTPKTELSDIVKEFLKMVRNFSGSTMAKNAHEYVTEIDNQFSLLEEFKPLYKSRMLESDFKYQFLVRKLSIAEKIERKGAPPYCVNFGQSISQQDGFTLSGSGTRTSDTSKSLRDVEKNGMRSPLFFWIVVLICAPLLLTTVTISAILMGNISQSFPAYVHDAKQHFVEAEIFALQTYVSLRANLTAATTERPTRDLHVLTRYIGWTLFGGIEQRDGFTQLTTGIEECKIYSNITDCPYTRNRACECAKSIGTCSDEKTLDSPYLKQPAFYSGESHDAELNGDRFGTSYPEVSYSQQSTAWWDAYADLPGANSIFRNGSRYESTYDRIRSVGSLPIMELLYNYEPREDRLILGVFIAFEADGLMTGFSCDEPGDHVGFAQWISSVENGAYALRPELCPLGKYGYDPRCRNWYHNGRDAIGGNKSAIYATPPYRFASSVIFAQSASSPLVDPRTGKHVGQTLIDYISQPIVDSLNETNFALSGKGFPVLITIDGDNFEADTVIGPGLDGTSKPITELVLPNNPACEGEACEKGFYAILKDMKAGSNGTRRFTRIAGDGSEEAIYISYAPVFVKTFAAVDGSDFGRGVLKSDYLLYSLAFAEYEDAMLDPFYDIQSDIDAQLYITVAVLCITIILSTAFIVYFSKAITVSMTAPMLHLLELIKTINLLKDGEDRPEAAIDKTYGSWEVLNVTITMERLYKVIRSANAAFFAGDVERAYEVLKDALKLFKRLGNQKAIGVACNNLGNTMLAAYRTLKETQATQICGFQKKEIISKGTACFHEAIQQGEKAYDEFYEREGWSPNCLDFMQHLSNRYFNRAMFLLTIKDDHPQPDEIQKLGMRDLQISRDMDLEIIEEGSQVGWNVRGPAKTFEVMLSRFRGHLLLLGMGFPDKFDLEEWMYEAFNLVKSELKNQDTSALFDEMGPAGRMQQIELELIKYYMLMKDANTAAKIGVRMLYEDEFTLTGAQLIAVEALQMYADKTDSGIKDDVKGALAEYRQRVEVSVDELDMYRASQAPNGEHDAVSLHSIYADEDVSMPFPSDKSADLSFKRISKLHHSRGDLTMETF